MVGPGQRPRGVRPCPRGGSVRTPTTTGQSSLSFTCLGCKFPLLFSR
jgi:hypothetical protein